jgi:hypothetical protein
MTMTLEANATTTAYGTWRVTLASWSATRTAAGSGQCGI